MDLYSVDMMVPLNKMRTIFETFKTSCFDVVITNNKQTPVLMPKVSAAIQNKDKLYVILCSTSLLVY